MRKYPVDRHDYMIAVMLLIAIKMILYERKPVKRIKKSKNHTLTTCKIQNYPLILQAL